MYWLRWRSTWGVNISWDDMHLFNWQEMNRNMQKWPPLNLQMCFYLPLRMQAIPLTWEFSLIKRGLDLHTFLIMSCTSLKFLLRLKKSFFLCFNLSHPPPSLLHERRDGLLLSLYVMEVRLTLVNWPKMTSILYSSASYLPLWLKACSLWQQIQVCTVISHYIIKKSFFLCSFNLPHPLPSLCMNEEMVFYSHCV